jgi:protein-S-isoprenylcysteine O-methyltransferase Ste14
MSSRFNITYSSATVAILGVALLIMGVLLTFDALSSEWVLGQRILTPIGVVLVLLGLIILSSKEA